TDDYMPMPIQNADEYEKVVNVSWYTPDRSVSDMVFPCVFPFSQMYPLCCIDIRNFLNQFYFFVASDFQHPQVVDERLKTALDDLVETAEYDFSPPRRPTEPSTYIQTLTQYLSNIMSSVLLSLPTEIKELMLFNAVSHTAESILALPLSPSVRRINPYGVQQL